MKIGEREFQWVNIHQQLIFTIGATRDVSIAEAFSRYEW